MSNPKYTRIYFVYESGDQDQIRDMHEAYVAENTDFDVSAVFIKSSLGNVRVSPNIVESITNKAAVENYTYTTGGRTIDLCDAPLLSYYIKDRDIREFNNSDDRDLTAQQLDDLVDMVRTGYEATEQRPVAVFATTPDMVAFADVVGHSAITAESVAHDEYECLGWLMVFTPSMVEQYGRETLQSAPACRIEQFDDGSILLICNDRPFDHERIWRDVADHIGLPLIRDLT